MSAKGSLILARDPHFQALFAIRGVSANVFKLTIDKIIGDHGNKTFTDLSAVCNIQPGSKFDIDKLVYNKIIIASDADIDGFFIRSLLLAFFFKVYPEIILQGRLYIAEPPLYRIDDKKDPFVINKKDYINRYMNKASQFYKFGYKTKKDVNYINKNDFAEFLADTSSYVDDMNQIVNHYVVNDRLLEMIYEEFAIMKIDFSKPISDTIKKININKLLNRINITFPELYYEDNIIRGSIDAKYQMIEITEHLIRKGKSIIETMMKWLPNEGTILFLKDVKTGTEYELSLLGILKILKKYQPKILHRFKGLGENDEKDLRKCIMDPNTRTLIKVQMSDIENDMKTFQLLRGNNTSDALGRKVLMREYQIDKDEIDT